MGRFAGSGYTVEGKKPRSRLGSVCLPSIQVSTLLVVLTQGLHHCCVVKSQGARCCGRVTQTDSYKHE